jgi:hypothetical protein
LQGETGGMALLVEQHQADRDKDHDHRKSGESAKTHSV